MRKADLEKILYSKKCMERGITGVERGRREAYLWAAQGFSNHCVRRMRRLGSMSDGNRVHSKTPIQLSFMKRQEDTMFTQLINPLLSASLASLEIHYVPYVFYVSRQSAQQKAPARNSPFNSRSFS